MVDTTPKVATVRYALAEGKLCITLNDSTMATKDSTVPENIVAMFTTTDISTLSSTLLMERTTLLSTAITAGTVAAKQTSTLVPMCHPVPITKCGITITGKRVIKQDISDSTISSSSSSSFIEIKVQCKVHTLANTGIEMEALTGTTVTLLTLYDMLKNAVPHSLLRIQTIEIMEKYGGKSGHYRKNTENK